MWVVVVKTFLKETSKRALLVALALVIGVSTPADASYEFRALNDQLWYEDECAPGAGSGGGTSGGQFEGGDNPEKVWNFLKSKGFSDEQVAGIMGNLAHESGDPTLSKTDATDGRAVGLAQWQDGRLTSLKNAASQQGRDAFDMQFQLEYLYEEMQTRTPRDGGFSTEEQGMKNQTSVEKATEYFMYNYERPGIPHLDKRIEYAKQYLERFGGTGGGGTSSADCACTPQSSPIKSVANSVDTTGADERIQKVIDAAIADANGKGVDLRIAVSGDAKASGGAGGQLPSASVIKLLVAAALSNNKVPLASVTGDLTTMIRDSNNDAANRLIDKAGGFGSINATARSLGADASIGRKMLQSAGAVDPNRISAQGSDTILNAIKSSQGAGGKISKDYADAIMAAMKSQTVNTKWGTSGIPKDKMAHKTGELNGAQHDVGYFFDGDKWLAVSILSNGGSAEPGVTIVKETAKKIYDAWLNGAGSSGGGGDGCGGVTDGECGEGGFIGTLKCYAWPEYSTRTDQMPDYAAATARAHSDVKLYKGGSGGGVAGNDCGFFVTRLLIDSGFEPAYNYNGTGGNTVEQYKWTSENWETLGTGATINAADLRPGDVANDRTNHTFIYVGKVNGFKDQTGIASASLGGPPRAPMEGKESPTDAGMTWFRKKG